MMGPRSIDATESLRALGAAAPTDRARAEAAAARFEQLFVQQMVQALRDSASLGSEGMFGSGPGSGTFADWFDTHLARHLTESGGIGLGQALLRSWERGGSIAPQAAGGTDVRA